MNRLLKKKALFCIAMWLVLIPAFGDNQIGYAQLDTVRLDINVAEQRLVSKSFMLLAEKYNINIAQSEVTQARAWYNPNIVYTQSLYDPASGVWLDNAPASGQVDVQITQLFSLAGRHINAVHLAQLEVQRSKFAFDELARSLKYEMYTDLAALYQAQQTDKLLTVELAALQNLILAEQKELNLGAAAGNDVIRLKAELQTTLTDRMENRNQIDVLEARLRVLLGFPDSSWLLISTVPAPSTQLPALDSLMQLTLQRPDVQLANTDVQWSLTNRKLQRSEAMPDLLVGAEYDRRSSYTNNLWTIGAGIDIPIFNRNQGNIRAANYQVLQSQYTDSLAQSTARSEVEYAYTQFVRTRNVRDSITSQPGVISRVPGVTEGSYVQDLELLFTNAITNYSSQRISLIEFLDQLRTYDDARRGVISLDTDYFLAAQQLNYVIGTMIVR